MSLSINELMLPLLIIIVLQISSYHIGRQVSKRLYSDYDIARESKLGVPIWFSLMFSSSCGLCFCMLLEILDIWKESRMWYWKACIWMNLVMLIAVLPILQSFIMTRKWILDFTLKARISILFIIWCIWLFLFWKVGNQDSIQLEKMEWTDWLFLQSLSRIGIIGVALISILSGFGAVYNAYIYLPLLNSVNLEDLTKSELELTNTLQMVTEKQKQLSQELSSLEPNIGTSSNSGFFGSMINNISQSFTQRGPQALQNELDTLTSLQAQISSEVSEVLRRKDRLVYSGTLKGRAMDTLGYLFGGYCIYRIFMSLINIILGRRSQTDPVTQGLSILVSFLNLDLDQKFWAQQLSFILIGILIVSSIRSLLIYFMKITKMFTSQSLRENLIIFLAQTMGMYFLSTVLLMRSNFPESYRDSLSQVLGSLSFDFYYRWFDMIFILASIVSIVAFYLFHNHLQLDYGLAN